MSHSNLSAYSISNPIPNPDSSISNPIPNPDSSISNPIPNPDSSIPNPIPHPVHSIPNPIPHPVHSIIDPDSLIIDPTLIFDSNSPILDPQNEEIHESYSDDDINIKNNTKNSKNSKKRSPIHDYLDETDDGLRVCKICNSDPDIDKP
ncbi:996_t:CDS:1, partial [Ambispora leptoticha]